MPGQDGQSGIRDRGSPAMPIGAASSRRTSAMGTQARHRHPALPDGKARPSGQPPAPVAEVPADSPQRPPGVSNGKGGAPEEVPANRLLCLRTGLEDPLQAELNPARLARRVDRSGRRPTDRGVRPPEDGCVGEIEGLEPELDVVTLPRQGKPARQGEVDCRGPRSPDQVPACIVDDARSAGHDGIGVEPAVDRSLAHRQVDVPDHIAAVSAAHVRRVLVDRVAVRRPSEKVQDSADLPAPEYP